jgi:hypothetical protein
MRLQLTQQGRWWTTLRCIGKQRGGIERRKSRVFFGAGKGEPGIGWQQTRLALANLSAAPLAAALPVCRRIQLFYHQQAMIWGWYMLEPWETVLWMSLLLLLTYLVLSACFLNPSSVCRQTLVAARNGLAARGAKLLAFAR